MVKRYYIRNASMERIYLEVELSHVVCTKETQDMKGKWRTYYLFEVLEKNMPSLIEFLQSIGGKE